MAAPDENGKSGRDHLIQATRTSRRRPAVLADIQAQLRGPRFPEALRYLWEWYLDLRRGFDRGGMGESSLTWTVFDAWARRTQNDPEPHEVAALFRLDATVRDPVAVNG